MLDSLSMLEQFPEHKIVKVSKRANIEHNIELSNSRKLSELSSRLRNDVVDGPLVSNSKVLAVPDLVALDPDLVLEQKKENRKNRRLQ
ncbi:uncharacterized protein PRCAT00000435001 [Priceomyces carsonii]|uniref:uncharacterized protein n=1 Tax=Priceomyces carsonii TaxID=28549 RepID=UPI002EDBB7D6|nr:unnamed protein product [Priceomyces carsonii]